MGPIRCRADWVAGYQGALERLKAASVAGDRPGMFAGLRVVQAYERLPAMFGLWW